MKFYHLKGIYRFVKDVDFMLKLNQPLRYFLLFAFTFIFIRILAVYTDFADLVFPELNYFISKIVRGFSSIFPFSVGDVFYFILGILLVVFLVKLIIGIFKKNWIEIKKLTSVLFLGLTLIMLIFHFFWGFNYYKKPVNEYYNVEKINTEELKILAEYYLKKSVETREFVNENEEGIFTVTLNSKDINNQILNSSNQLKKYKELRINKISSPNLKKSLYSEGFSYMGVLGYYNPFTTEAQYNSKMPDTKLLFTKFHEVAHQWGFAAESEANFVGFLIGIESENKEFNYVSNYKALRSLLNKIIWEDPLYVQLMLNAYSPKMKKDREYEKLIQEKYLHTADDTFSMLNEAYLKLNNQDGLESYGRFVELLVGYHRKQNAVTE